MMAEKWIVSEIVTKKEIAQQDSIIKRIDGEAHRMTPAVGDDDDDDDVLYLLLTVDKQTSLSTHRCGFHAENKRDWL